MFHLSIYVLVNTGKFVMDKFAYDNLNIRWLNKHKFYLSMDVYMDFCYNFPVALVPV